MNSNSKDKDCESYKKRDWDKIAKELYILLEPFAEKYGMTFHEMNFWGLRLDTKWNYKLEGYGKIVLKDNYETI